MLPSFSSRALLSRVIEHFKKYGYVLNYFLIGVDIFVPSNPTDGVIAAMVGRLCSRKFDLGRLAEIKCSSCIDGILNRKCEDLAVECNSFVCGGFVTNFAAPWDFR
ncbi:hypothetical protein FNV43_RR11659 [Rhamnella rubrinervis]|uniref:Uncharacterized protein n=1 Tax=Rhamnella rubrinervis TaxID=2594499 RepID=A0A8K0MI32_9ROSA|nr:hypothetical protein FNV43_RR11659 [Rhamnella rubrinervis]